MENLSQPAGFSLIEEPWIPVLGMDGRQRDVSLQQLIEQAEEIRMISCELPTQTFAILRLVLAILHRATDGPETDAAWRTLWNSPGLPAVAVEYLEEMKHRFDLLHPVQPFYQVAGLHTARNDTFGLERIIADVPNGFPYLTSRAGSGMDTVTPAEAARWVVHCQAFDPSGIKSGAVGDPRVIGGRGYPIGVGSAGSLGGVYLEGPTLRHTLLLNLVPTGSGILRSYPNDLPTWERDPQGPAEEPQRARGPLGVLTLYTWQSRRILLYGDRTGVTGAMIANGDKIDWQDLHLSEPMSVWGRSAPREKLLKRTVYLPRPHDHTRAMWRGLATLLPEPVTAGAEPPKHLSPLVMQWLARLSNSSLVAADFTVRSRAVSITYGNQQSVIEQIFSDGLTMHVQVASTDSALRTTVIDSAYDAERAVQALRSLADNLVLAAAGSGTINGAADRASEMAYASLDTHFRRWLGELGPDSDPLAQRAAWQRSVQRTVVQLGRDLITSSGPAAWVGRMVKDRSGNEIHHCSSRAEAWFRRRIRKELPLAAHTTATHEEVPA